jgi:HEAT repeat protein
MAVEHVASGSDAESLAALCRSLRDTDWLVRARARRSLLEKLEEVDARGEGAWLTDQLLDYHRSPLPGPRVDLIAVLGHRTGARVEEALMRVLDVPDGQERQAAVSALARHHRKELLPAFLRLAAMDPVASVRREAVRALQDHGAPEVILPLIERLRDADGGVREEAHGGLVRLSGVDHGLHYWSWVEWSKELPGSSDDEAISP